MQFDRLKPGFHEKADQPKWSGLEEASHTLDPDGAQHRQRLAKFLGDLVCEPAGAPYVARRVVISDQLAALGDQLEGVRKRMKGGRDKPDACKGVLGFTEDGWRRLDAIAPAQDTPPADR